MYVVVQIHGTDLRQKKVDRPPVRESAVRMDKGSGPRDKESYVKRYAKAAGVAGVLAILFAAPAAAPADPGCPNGAIRDQQHSTYLPQCRAYEQVSPVDKNGTDVQNW